MKIYTIQYTKDQHKPVKPIWYHTKMAAEVQLYQEGFLRDEDIEDSYAYPHDVGVTLTAKILTLDEGSEI